jgi:hypothetical protein
MPALSDFESVGAANLGEFSLSPDFRKAGPDIIRAVHRMVLETCGAPEVAPQPLAAVQAVFEERDDVPAQIISSYLGLVANHVNRLRVPWDQMEVSPQIELRSSLFMRPGAEREVHQDFADDAKRSRWGIRLVTMNHSPVEVDEVPHLQAGQVVRTVHRRTWHNAPAFRANRFKPRLFLASDFFVTLTRP